MSKVFSLLFLVLIVGKGDWVMITQEFTKFNLESDDINNWVDQNNEQISSIIDCNGLS